MLYARFTGPFKKDRKLMEKRQMDMACLNEVMEFIQNERPLPEHHHPHPLHGKWKGCIDCHVINDWVLIYEIDPEGKTVTFHRTGTHSDLFRR
jgi:mRNA interferase YafQ